MEQIEFEKLLQNLVALPAETEIVEFKVNYIDKDEIGKRISALSNSANLYDKKDGFLVFGIKDETHDIVGTEFVPSKEKIGNEGLEFWLSKHLDPKLDFRIHEMFYDNKRIVLIVIPPAVNQPIKFNNIAYIRLGSTTPKLSDYPDKESKIWNNINRKSFEKGIAK